LDIVKIVEERLSIFKNLYDVIRIIDPINKKRFTINESQELVPVEACYCFWERNINCENCVSMRAYLEDDTFVKMEYKDGKVFIVISSPLILEGTKYVIEVVKDISQKGYIEDHRISNIHNPKNLIIEMNEKIIKDELTGIYNRRYINERLIVDVNSSIITGQALAIVMADIDSFKNINDSYGHLIGDRVLKDFAEFLNNSIRKDKEWVGRYGGEEFLIVLNNTNAEEAYEIAEKMRKQLENKVFIYDNVKVNITSSFGVYGVNSQKIDIETLIDSADKNLYEAKKSGKNKVIIGK
jgi:two-component system, cell cycle response regulator